MPVPFPQGPTYKKTAKKYTVRTGDTWNSIAKQNGVPVNQITGANQGMSLTPGVVVRIPAATTGIYRIPTEQSGGRKPPQYTPSATDWINPIVKAVTNVIQNWGVPYRAGMGDVQRAGNYPSQYPASTVNPTAQQQQASAFNRIANMPVKKDLYGLPQKDLDEYASYIDWVGRDPDRLARYQAAGYDFSYNSYLNTKFSGGGGDFWEYMQGVNQASGGGGYSSAKRRNQKEMESYKEAKENDPTLTRRKWMMRKSGHGQGTYSTAIEEETGNAAVQVSGGYSGSGYNYYRKPESFGLVTWRT